ncbi:hypothetical protein BDB01DRAFT_805036 [Pilobolus umbonatus]|nr:hypothetical protein BDB01DRAFT_805036 [Pilobolus umbonatus]
MATYHAVLSEETQPPLPTLKSKKVRSALASLMLIICLISFVIQTELAQFVQKTTNYSKPYFILYLSHSCYTFMIPLQFTIEYFTLPTPKSNTMRQNIGATANSYISSVSQSLMELQYRIQGHHKNTIWFLISTGISLAVLITMPSYIWYLSVNFISMSSLTAIYNTGCFFAYVFSVIFLKDRIVAAKVGAVMLCMVGVLVMACWPQSDQEEGNEEVNNAWIGVFISTLGAALYGYYEVYYKKYASPSNPTILFANTMTGIIGIVTFLLLWIPIPVLNWIGFEVFELPDRMTFFYMLAIASMSVIYNATFMAVIALVNPVFAAVGVMLTIPAVAITDVIVTGVMIPIPVILGSILILIGFFILNQHVDEEEVMDPSLTMESQ